MGTWMPPRQDKTLPEGLGDYKRGLLAVALYTFNTETSLCGTQMDQGIWRGHEPHDLTRSPGFYPAPSF